MSNKNNEVIDVEAKVIDTQPAPEPSMDVPANVPQETPVYVPDDHSVFKNIATGIGIGLLGCAAMYGAYSLIKKGVKMIKDKRAKKGNGLEHPNYDYVKAETPNEVPAKESEAPKEPENKKRPIGFHCDK